MRSLEQIVADNGNDNTPGMDTHNLTGRAKVYRYPETWPGDDAGKPYPESVQRKLRRRDTDNA